MPHRAAVASLAGTPTGNSRWRTGFRPRPTVAAPASSSFRSTSFPLHGSPAAEGLARDNDAS